MGTKAIESTGNNDYETPFDVFRHWDDIFHFTLDVCAIAENAKCVHFITAERDTFKTEWRSKNWMNPPYGKPEAACKPVCVKKRCLPATEENPNGRGHCITQDVPGLSDFIRLAYERSLEGKLVVALIPVSTATKWWQSYVTKADHVYYYPERINFLLQGKVVKGVAFDPCIVIWGLHPQSTRDTLK